jgi:hypothetical protein
MNKMKNILNSRYFVALGILSVLIFTQCKDEDYTGYGTVNPSNPTVAITWDAPATMEESDVTYPFTVTLSEVQIADIVFNISADASTATEGEDFDLSTHTIRIPAYSTEGSGSLTIYSDALPEETETISVQIGDAALGNVNYTPETRSIDITNLVSDDILVSFDWSGTFDGAVDGVATAGIDLCAVDMDFLLGDDTTVDIGDYTCATGACPEQYLFTAGSWTNGDGTFYFGVNLWDAGGITAADGSPTTFPVTMYIAQVGVVNLSATQDASTVIMSDNDGSTVDAVLKVVVAGSSFSFYDGTTDALIYAN